MTPEWTPEHVVDESRAGRLVASQFPDLAGAPVTLLASGWDSTVHVVDGRWAFRFPRREMAVVGLRREIEVLPLVQAHVPLPIPTPVLVGAAQDDFPWPFVGSELLAGTELAESGLAEADRVGVATGVGEFLRALHAPALRDLVGARLPVDPMGRADPAVRVPKTRDFVTRLALRVPDLPVAGIDALLAEAASAGAPVGDPVVSHGDLHARHVLVADARATGVIDWNDVCLADPAVDLSVAYAVFSGAARDALLSAYGAPVDPARELRARMLAVFLCVALAEYAASEGRAALLDESLRGLGRALA